MMALWQSFSWAEIQWQHAEFFWLIVLWPVLWVWSRWRAVWDDRQALSQSGRLSARHILVSRMQQRQAGQGGETPQGTWRFSVSWLLLECLRGALIICLAAALAQPQKPLPPEAQPNPKTVRDLVFVVESSASFLLPDYRFKGHDQTRMDAVKLVLQNFMAALDGNRFAVVIYADQAFTLMPLTADQQAAQAYLQRLKPYLAGRTDEASGEALGLALREADKQRADMQTVSDLQDSARKRVVVLISDGMNRPSRVPMDEAVNYAQVLKVPVYTVGVGSNSSAADLRQFSGLLYQPLQAEVLQQIAAQTGGRYFKVESGEGLQQVLQSIDKLEGVAVPQAEVERHWQDLTHWLLLMAVVLFAVYALLLWLLKRQDFTEAQA
ncbi:vWA domain-containing protein [Thiomicrorhabdus heinhorstiae]|uniref:VWA domain-containing protein n=1 Tax=Thiomicrorhabdus heinhorstiae TaxID=2748010 RepID=A0ABS0BXX2_9GAMM|nr:VWA domain-containing protein [Thiomicrorhabdus heinhorstiae]MBF6057696.1 VWA domain-containing protein [Thiomicrorhabdus heinhorstiae]